MTLAPGTEAAAPQTARLVPGSRPSLARAVLQGCLLGLGLAVLAEAGRVFVGGNLHAVVPGRVYRSSQPSPEGLERLVYHYGIRTVVNLRGCCDPCPWYLDESRVTHRLGVAQEDICLSAGRLPAVPEIQRLVEVLDRTEYPILLHCWRGADRTGLVSAIVLLLYTPADIARARRQLGLRYGHLALGRPAYLDLFLDLYAEWLRQAHRVHSAPAFREWVAHGYRPAECWCTIEPLDLPARVPCGRPTAVRVRVRNTGLRTWELRPGNNAGVHAGYIVWNCLGVCVAKDRAGLFNAEVAPGASIELTLALPPFRFPGRYRLFVDMEDERHCWFYQAGSEPLECDLEVR